MKGVRIGLLVMGIVWVPLLPVIAFTDRFSHLEGDWLLLIPLSVAVLSYAYANHLGRSGALWALLGIVPPFISPLVLFFMRPLNVTSFSLKEAPPDDKNKVETLRQNLQLSKKEKMAYYCNKEWNFSIKYPTDWKIVWENEPAGSWTMPVAVAGEKRRIGRPCFMVNARRDEILRGSDNFIVNQLLEDGSVVTVPRDPAEYIELNKKTLAREFPGYQFISAEETSIGNRPAARMVYSYDGRISRIQEESITWFGAGVTFQFICEVPVSQHAEFQPYFKDILESLKLGHGMPQEEDTAKKGIL